MHYVLWHERCVAKLPPTRDITTGPLPHLCPLPSARSGDSHRFPDSRSRRSILVISVFTVVFGFQHFLRLHCCSAPRSSARRRIHLYRVSGRYLRLDLLLDHIGHVLEIALTVYLLFRFNVGVWCTILVVLVADVELDRDRSGWRRRRCTGPLDLVRSRVMSGKRGVLSHRVPIIRNIVCLRSRSGQLFLGKFSLNIRAPNIQI